MNFLVVIHLIFLILPISSQANMSEFLLREKKAEAQKQVWNVLTLEWPPYTCTDCPGQGAAAEALRQVLAQKGITVNFVFRSWTEAIKESSQLQYVGFFPAYVGEEPEGYQLSSSLFQSPLGFVKSKDKKISWKNLEDLKGLSIGGAKDYKYPQEFFAKAKSGFFKLELVVSDDTNLRKVASGDLDLAILDMVNAQFLLKNSPGFLQSKLELDPKPYKKMDLYFAFNKRHTALAPVLNQLLLEASLQQRVDSAVTKMGLSTK